MEKRVLVMNPADNVGVLLEAAGSNDTCIHADLTITILEPIEFAHKVALADIPAEAWVVKYGENIGYATGDIKRGEWVHTHNMTCDRGR